MTRIIRYQLRKEGLGVWDVCDIQTGSGVPPPTPSPLSNCILMRRYTTSPNVRKGGGDGVAGYR